MERLINKLKSYPGNKYGIVVDALIELDAMIGLVNVKQKVIEIVCESIAPEGPICNTNGNHCLVIGPPGVGKTTFIEILAKIMFGLGITTKVAKGSIKSKEVFHMVAGLSFLNEQANQALNDLSDNWTSSSEDTPHNPNVKTRLGWLAEASGDLLKEYQPQLGGLTEPIKPHIVRVTRTDIIGKYHGTSAVNMQDMFEKARGGVLMIDEAYSILTDNEDDLFGKEVVNHLNLTMNNIDTVVILCGYKDKIEDSLFKYQHGLSSRIQHVFELDIPTSLDLAVMMHRKINKRSKLTVNQIKELLTHDVTIEGYGRGIEKWARQSSLVSSIRIVLDDDKDNSLINLDDLKLGLERCGYLVNKSYDHMYT